MGLLLKHPRPHHLPGNLENKSRGSGLKLREGNPEVESLTMFCTNPPYATCPPGLKGRHRILPGICRHWHLPLQTREAREGEGGGPSSEVQNCLSKPGTGPRAQEQERWWLRGTEAKAGKG